MKIQYFTILFFIFSNFLFGTKKNINFNKSFFNNEKCLDTLPEKVVKLDTLADIDKKNRAKSIIANDAGMTAGALSVTPTGASSYTIPIANLTSVKNLAPNITLTYNSQSGNGIAGWGWNLSGISTITRVPSTKYLDGYIDPVDFDTKDRFALDGQRLINKSGVYGAPNSIYETEKYSNLKIKAFGTSPYGSKYGPAYFIVYYPNGSRAWFGISGNSRNRLEWSIYKLEDPQGNNITYLYTISNGLLKVKEIRYGSGSGSVGPNAIKFFYKKRSRPEMFYMSGVQFSRTDILDKIEVSGNNELFRKYQLNYTYDRSYQKLVKLQEFNGINGSFEAIRFDYPNSNSKSLEPINDRPYLFFPGISTKDHIVISGDYDGNGHIDFLTFNARKKENIRLFNQFFNPISPQNGSTVGIPVSTEGMIDAVFPGTFMDSNYKIATGNAINVVTEKLTNNATKSKVAFKICQFKASGFNTYLRTWNAPTDTQITEEGQVRKKIPKYYLPGDYNGDGVNDVLVIDKPYSKGTCPHPGCIPEPVSIPNIHFIDYVRPTFNII